MEANVVPDDDGLAWRSAGGGAWQKLRNATRRWPD